MCDEGVVLGSAVLAVQCAVVACCVCLLTPATEDAYSARDGAKLSRATGGSESGSTLRAARSPARTGSKRLQVISSDDPSIELAGTQLEVSERRDELHTVRHTIAGHTHAWYCCLGCLLGFVGFGLTLMSAIADVCHNPEGTREEGVLPRWPSTVSEINSDFSSGRGRLFFGFMLVSSAFLFAARMPTALDSPLFESELWKLGVAVQGSVDKRDDKWRVIPLPDKFLLHFRSLTAPVGAVFVALCPTVNFWSAHHAGQEVVRSVHLVAAAFLFLGGTGAEVWRLVRLHAAWKRKDAFTRAHCARCIDSCRSREEQSASKETGRTTQQFFLNEKILSSQLPGKHQPTGPIRPFLVLCLCLNILAIAPDLHAEHGVSKDTIVAKRGEIVLSPTATGYCPGREFRYASISTHAQCERASELLSADYTSRPDLLGRYAEEQVWSQGSPQAHATPTESNASRACYVSFADVESAGMGAQLESDLLDRTRAVEPEQYATEGGCAVLANFEANASACVPMDGLTCRSKIILPRVVALCVCVPQDCQGEDCECRWANAAKSSLRLRIFILESSLTILLLFNYMTIALEHEIQLAEAEIDEDAVPHPSHYASGTYLGYRGFTYTRMAVLGLVCVYQYGVDHVRVVAAAALYIGPAQSIFSMIVVTLVIALLSTCLLSSHCVSEAGRYQFLHVLRALLMSCVFLAIDVAQSVFIAIRREQDEHDEYDRQGSFAEWVVDLLLARSRFARMLAHAFCDGEGSEDLVFGAVFSLERCFALVITVVVVADAADKFRVVARCCGRKCEGGAGSYERAAPSDDGVAAGASLEVAP